MKFLVPLSLFLVITVSACEDDDVFNPLITLGRFQGWQIVSVESDLASNLMSAIVGIPDSTLLAYDTTVEELIEEKDSYVVATTIVESCEKDDALFFDLDVMGYGVDGEDCPPNGPEHVLTPFDDKAYAADLNVTKLTVSDPANSTESVYDVVTITAQELVLTQQRSVPAQEPIPAYTYSITYYFTAR